MILKLYEIQCMSDDKIEKLVNQHEEIIKINNMIIKISKYLLKFDTDTTIDIIWDKYQKHLKRPLRDYDAMHKFIHKTFFYKELQPIPHHMIWKNKIELLLIINKGIIDIWKYRAIIQNGMIYGKDKIHFKHYLDIINEIMQTIDDDISIYYDIKCCSNELHISYILYYSLCIIKYALLFEKMRYNIDIKLHNSCIPLQIRSSLQRFVRQLLCKINNKINNVERNSTDSFCNIFREIKRFLIQHIMLIYELIQEEFRKCQNKNLSTDFEVKHLSLFCSKKTKCTNLFNNDENKHVDIDLNTNEDIGQYDDKSNYTLYQWTKIKLYQIHNKYINIEEYYTQLEYNKKNN